jgi:hypothetical protein
MRIVTMDATEFEGLSAPGLDRRRWSNPKKGKEKADKEIEKLDKDRHEAFFGKFPRWRKKEMLDLLRGQNYYKDGNKVVIATATPGVKMELTPSGEGFKASIKNDRGATKSELTNCNSVGELKVFMKDNDVSAPSLFSKKHSRLENPQDHKQLAREV